jgi:hypothetical protein
METLPAEIREETAPEPAPDVDESFNSIDEPPCDAQEAAPDAAMELSPEEEEEEEDKEDKDVVARSTRLKSGAIRRFHYDSKSDRPRADDDRFLRRDYVVKTSSLAVLRLGTIQHDKPSFLNASFVLPLGYQAQRVYFSYKRPGQRCLYLCEIGIHSDVCSAHF